MSHSMGVKPGTDVGTLEIIQHKADLFLFRDLPICNPSMCCTFPNSKCLQGNVTWGEQRGFGER